MPTTPDPARTIFSLTGADVIPFLQGILTQDVTRLAVERILFTALLSPQGKILHDGFLIAGETTDDVWLDTATADAETFRKRLMLYKLRAKVVIAPSDRQVGYAAQGGLADPRHAGLPHRVYGPEGGTPLSPADAARIRLTLGIPECGVDFAADSVVTLDAGYDMLHGVSFTKGCYVGQEITARMHYKNIARRGFHVLSRDGAPEKLALLKFEDVPGGEGAITLDGITYHAQLPDWRRPPTPPAP